MSCCESPFQSLVCVAPGYLCEKEGKLNRKRSFVDPELLQDLHSTNTAAAVRSKQISKSTGRLAGSCGGSGGVGSFE
jgi:hypothetical protein